MVAQAPLFRSSVIEGHICAVSGLLLSIVVDCVLVLTKVSTGNVPRLGSVFLGILRKLRNFIFVGPTNVLICLVLSHFVSY